jgi:kynurenine formamidase
MISSKYNMEQLGSIIKNAIIVDLSPILENDIPRFTTHPPLVIHQTMTHNHDGYYCQSIFMPEHIGAHVDAPSHIHPEMSEDTIDRVSIDSLIGRAIVLDLTAIGLDAGEYATEKDIRKAEKARKSTIKRDDIVLINFGWQKKHWTKGKEWSFYSGNAPGLDENVAHYLMTKGIKAIGTDTIACGTAIKRNKEKHCWIHELLLSKHIYLMECLTNLDLLPGEVFFIALPLRIKKGSGSPIRPIALYFNDSAC